MKTRQQLKLREQQRRRERRRLAWYFLVALVPLGLGVGMLLQPDLEQGPPPASTPTPWGATPSPALSAAPQALSFIPRPNQAANLLVMACDVEPLQRGGKVVLGLRGNTDSMLLVRLDPEHQAARVLSIPRDTRTRIPGHGVFKINAANPYGGPALAMRTVSEFLEVPVNRYLVLNTQAVIQLVDALGGVTVDVPKAMNYDDNTGNLHIHFRQGSQAMTGQQAEEFLRFRHDEQADIGRVQRLQAFFQAVMSQWLTPGNLLKTPQLLGMVQDNMGSDLSIPELLAIANWTRQIGRQAVTFAMVPGVADDVGRVSYWLPDLRGTRRVVRWLMATPELASPSPEARSREVRHRRRR